MFAMSSQEHWKYLCVCNVFIRSIGILVVFVMFPSEQGLWLGLPKIIGEMTYSRKKYLFYNHREIRLFNVIVMSSQEKTNSLCL